MRKRLWAAGFLVYAAPGMSLSRCRTFARVGVNRSFSFFIDSGSAQPYIRAVTDLPSREANMPVFPSHTVLSARASLIVRGWEIEHPSLMIHIGIPGASGGHGTFRNRGRVALA